MVSVMSWTRLLNLRGPLQFGRRISSTSVGNNNAGFQIQDGLPSPIFSKRARGRGHFGLLPDLNVCPRCRNRKALYRSCSTRADAGSQFSAEQKLEESKTKVVLPVPVFHPVEEELELGEDGIHPGGDPFDELSHLRTKLYDPEKDGTGMVEKLYEVASVQELLDLVNQQEEVLTPVIASQALVTLWDLQKLLFQLKDEFHPANDLMAKANFVKEVKQNRIFQERILQRVLETHEELEDEPLCASLLALRKMDFGIIETQPLINDCLRRKNNLALGGLSRLSVCLRSQDLYGSLVMSEFSPLVLKYVTEMKTDLEVRLVSILLRNVFRIVSKLTTKAYEDRISELLTNESEVEFDVVTYCKVFLALVELNCSSVLANKVGMMLSEKASEMSLMELLSMQKFLVGPVQQPYPLIEAIMDRNLRFVEDQRDRPRIDLIAATGPYIRASHRHKKKIAQLASECLSQNEFSQVQYILYPLIRNLRLNDREIYNQYWNGVSSVVENTQIDEFRRTIIQARNYLTFCHSHMFAYRNAWLESLLKKNIHAYLDMYLQNSPTLVIAPMDFAPMFAFLVAFDQMYLDLKYLSKFADFAPQIKTAELAVIAKAIDSALFRIDENKNTMSRRSYEIINEVCAILEEESALRLKNVGEDDEGDLAIVCRVISIIRKLKGDSPLLGVAMQKFMESSNRSSREIKEVCSLLASGNYLYPAALDSLSSRITDELEFLSPETLEKYVGMAYALGYESEKLDFGKISEYIEKYWDRIGLGIIQTAVALAFYRELQPSLISKIFTVEFLDQIDDELLNVFGRNHQYRFRLRTYLMELNRTVCLELPSARLPWFHEKFCQNLLSHGHPKRGYLKQEVEEVLTDLMGSGAIHSNICLSQDYYYNIDYVLKFDQHNQPIRNKSSSKLLSFARSRPEPSDDEVKRKVAILVLNNGAYTRHVRGLRGGYKMKVRHLEILGYSVVCIDPYHWNSMYMSENSVKQKFLESQIFDTGEKYKV